MYLCTYLPTYLSIYSNPIQSNPTQPNPIQSNPIYLYKQHIFAARYVKKKKTGESSVVWENHGRN